MWFKDRFVFCQCLDVCVLKESENKDIEMTLHRFFQSKIYRLHPATLVLSPYMEMLYKFDNIVEKTTLASLKAIPKFTVT